MSRHATGRRLQYCVFGAGVIGCYLGGRLQAAGTTVRFIGRQRLGAELATHGLRLSDYRGTELAVPPGAVDFTDNAEAAAAADVVLVTVKTAATHDVGQALAHVLKPGARVVSFQNGLHNAEWLTAALPQQAVLAGMVPFNVLARGEGRFHQGSSGALVVQQDAALDAVLQADFRRAGLPLKLHADMRAVQWAKLLLNLNNPVNALSGLPLRQELSQRDFRRCLAAAQREALGLYKAAGIRLARLTPLPPHWLAVMLELPDAVFRRVFGAALAIDPLARSSMWDDLQLGRPTEVDWINGEIVRLARELGRSAPVNGTLVNLIHAAEQGDDRQWSGPALLAEIRRQA